MKRFVKKQTNKQPRKEDSRNAQDVPALHTRLSSATDQATFTSRCRVSQTKINTQ